MNKKEYKYFLYLQDKIDQFVGEIAIDQAHKKYKGKRKHYSAEVSGCGNNEEYWVKVFRLDDPGCMDITVNIKDHLK